VRAAAFSRRSLLGLLAVAAAALPGLAGLAGPARASAFAPVIPRGGVALPTGARDLGRLAPGTELRVTVALRARHAAALAAYAASVSRAGTPEYHRYLTVAQFARRFGPTASQLRTVRAALHARGLSLGATSANRLSITARGSARVAAEAFGTAIDRYALRAGATQDAPASVPHLAGAAGALVQGVAGLDSIAPRAGLRLGRRRHARARHARARHARARHGAAARARTRTHASGHAAATGPQACAAATAAAGGQSGFTPAQIAGHYGLSGFYAAGDGGSGVTIALYELEPFSASDVAAYQACMGTATTVDVTAVDGGPGAGSGSGEAASDVEDVIGLAPAAQIDVYEGPATGQGAYDTYAAIVSQDAAQVISTSWGLCEAQVGSQELLAEDTLFQEAAVQGQTILAASGDSGADDCGNGRPSVDDPGSQPWVTSVGGTHLLAGGDTVWDDSAGASGGGASQFWGRPSWQTAAQAQSAVACGAAGTACREVPDISADGDPGSGYTAFFHGSWRTVGGTSVAAPTVASLVALAEASPACGGRRLGFLDPALYADAADIHDVTSGANTFGGVAGFPATAGYDMASGLGTPTAGLGPALCGDALAFTAPAAQRWTAGRPVSLALEAQSARGAAVTWSATGLPAGIALGGRSGRLTGAPTATGSFTVTVTAVDGDGATRSGSFTVSVAPRAATTGHRAAPPARRRRRRHRVHHRRRRSRSSSTHRRR
jgi:subtilase family serine protease